MMRPTSLTGAQARAYDRWCTDVARVPGIELMEHAAEAIAEAIEPWRPAPTAGDTAPTVDVACGSGNNGGDGYAVARLLHERGWIVSIIRLQPPRPGSDAAVNADRARAAGIPIVSPSTAAPVPRVIVDAILGTGFRSAQPLDDGPGKMIQHVRLAREGGALVVAVDIPSGLDADTGHAADARCCVVADMTVTMVLPKAGFGFADGPSSVGRVVVAAILPAGHAGPDACAWDRILRSHDA